MKSDNCSCKTTVEQCRTTAGERPRYFPRQLVTAEDLMMEQEYFRNRMRLHNRLLHGWGVVCGLGVAPIPKKDGSTGTEPWLVKVCPGDALDPYGNEIMAPCEVEVDLRQDSVSGSSIEPCGTVADVWCSDAWLQRDRNQKLYLAIRYAEVPTRPVRVQPAGCGCDDTACEYSRLRDGYEIKVLTEDEYRPLATDPGTLPNWRDLFPITLPRDPNPACWPCPKQPWVVLACIQLGANGEIMSIDNCGPRRLVAALGCFYWSCAGLSIMSVSDTSSQPSSFECGQRGNPINLVRGNTTTLQVVGEGFDRNPRVDLGPGIDTTVNEEASTSTMIIVEVTVAPDAPPPVNRDLIVINPDCSTAVCRLAIAVPESTVTGRAARASLRVRPLEEAVTEEAPPAEEPRPRRRRGREG